MQCNQTWNSVEMCRPFSYNVSGQEMAPTTPIPTPWNYDDRDYDYDSHPPRPDLYPIDPATEYVMAMDSFEASTIGALLLTWVAVTAPLVFGFSSLLKCFGVAFLLTHVLNLLLFFRALTLPGLKVGLHQVFLPQFDMARREDFWAEMIKVSVGSWFSAPFGVLLLVGQRAQETTFVFPHVLLTGIAVFLLNLLNLLKISGFVGFFQQFEEFNLGFDMEGGYPFHAYYGIPVLLSVIPGANFWLIVHFCFTLCCLLPKASLVLEVVLTSLSEFLPSQCASRDPFPRSLVQPCVVGVVGFAVSLALLYARGWWPYLFTFQLDNFLTLFYLVAIVYIAQAILPLSSSKVATAGHESLWAFVKRQSATATGVKFFVGLSLVVTFFIAYFLTVIVPAGAERGMPIAPMISRLGQPRSLETAVIVLLGLSFLVILGTAVVQSILFCVNGRKHPCCSPLGRRIEEEVEEKFVEKTDTV